MRNGFISYSHRDHAVLGRFLSHLASTEQHCGVKFWADTAIDPGRKWPGEIEAAIAAADVVLMLVSAYTWSSSYINDTEWPLIEKRVQAGVLLVPVLAKPCELPPYLSDIQAIPTKDKIIKAITTWPKQEVALDVANKQLRGALTRHFQRMDGGGL
jgi:hypothetical protein